jgi:CubicO group peptidase (beta-lactamase class C family)
MQATAIALFLLVFQMTFAQGNFSAVVRKSDSLFNKGLNEKMIPGGVVAIVQGDSAYGRAYGLRNVAQNLTADTTTLFQLGSVGKLFTAIAVLQQAEAGKLDLNKDVNQYLEGWSIASTGRPITLMDLLTHTAGLNDRIIGYLARSENEVQPLEEHLKTFMPSTFQSPGVEVNYSNYGYALAGHLVERVSGMPFTEYVQRNIFDRLGMRHTTYRLPDDYAQRDAYAVGYRTRETFEPVACYPRHATPAGSALSCASDMRKLLSEFLKPTSRILNAGSFDMLKRQQFSSHPLLMGYTLGMEEQYINGVRGIAKGGAFTGFLSEFVIFPDQQLGLFISTNTQTDNFLEHYRSEMFPRLLANPTPNALRKPIPMDVKEFAGVYRSERYNHTSVEDLLALYQGKLELSISKEGDLVTYQNGAWRHYRPVDSLIFQNQSAPEQFLVFRRDAEGNINRLYTNINLAGFYLPVSLTPVAWYDDPVMINEYYVLIPLVIFTFLLLPLFRGWVLFRRRKRPDYWVGKLAPTGSFYMGLLTALFFLIHFIWGFMFLARNVNDFYFGIPPTFQTVQEMTILLPIAVLLLVFSGLKLWTKKSGVLAFRIYYSLFCLSAVIHLAFLYRWHFIGLHT